MTCYACLFEAKSIQDYILRSGRLRHIVGASELIDSLTSSLLNDVLAALNLREDQDIRFSRRAGGAVYLFSARQEARDAFRDLWTLVVRQYAPGLEFIIAQGEGSNDFTAYEAAKQRLQAARNRQAPLLPSGGPVTCYAPRTGQPAVKNDNKLGLQDAATARFGLDHFWKRGGLTKKFAEDVPIDAWPRNLDYSPDTEDGKDFPFLPDNRYLGLIHADGNGLGQLLMKLGEQVKARPQQFVALFHDFSTAITTATQDAAQQATAQVLTPARRYDPNDADPSAGTLPARPIVLGGDDLTILVRADLAIPFTQAFLSAFERHSREQLTKLRHQYPDIDGLPEALTAGAGIAFVKSSHPFHLAHELAESLAKFAKNRAKAIVHDHQNRQEPLERIPPTLAFYRVTTASHGDYADICRDEMTHGPAHARVITSLGAYGIDPQPPNLPALTDLQALAGLMSAQDMARGPSRQILTLLGQDHDDARRRYARWREVMKEYNSENLKKIDQYLQQLCGSLDTDLPISEATKATPLGDLAMLLAVTKGAVRQSNPPEDAR